MHDTLVLTNEDTALPMSLPSLWPQDEKRSSLEPFIRPLCTLQTIASSAIFKLHHAAKFSQIIITNQKYNAQGAQECTFVVDLISVNILAQTYSLYVC